MVAMSLALVAALLLAQPRHFEVSAEYQAGAKRHGGVAVTFKALDPDPGVNEPPRPPLPRHPARHAGLPPPTPPTPSCAGAFGCPPGRPGSCAPAGPHDVKAKVTYFY